MYTPYVHMFQRSRNNFNKERDYYETELIDYIENLQTLKLRYVRNETVALS